MIADASYSLTRPNVHQTESRQSGSADHYISMKAFVYLGGIGYTF